MSKCSHLYLRHAICPVAFLLLLIVCGVVVSRAGSQTIGAQARRQIASAVAFKESLSPAEQKLSTPLALAVRAAAHKPLGELARLASSIPKDGWKVEVHAEMSPSLLDTPAMRSIEKTNGAPPSHIYQSKRALARVTLPQVLELASHSDVYGIHEAMPVDFNAGAVTSQGYIAHRAREVVQAGITGAGITVGILSDSASPTSVRTLIASGDLPQGTLVVPGLDGTDNPDYLDEGSAMMEVIHDVAPGANLVFAAAGSDGPTFASRIRLLRFQYHCDIIVDDFAYLGEAVFQDDEPGLAINDVTGNGALYVTAAGDYSNYTYGPSGTYEGDFRDSGTEIAGEKLHDFGTVGNPQPYNQLLQDGPAVVLYWSDSFFAADNDYDLFILDPTGTTLKAFSAVRQTGSQKALEIISADPSCGGPQATGYCPAPGDRILVGLYRGEARALHLRVRFGYPLSVYTDGAIFGHSGNAQAVSVAATAWNSSGGGPAPFSGARNFTEFFNSDGPRRIFYNSDGTPISPGKVTFASGGGTTLLKPDVTAADGVVTRTLRPFYGTSAAAPHVAGIAALVRSANPKLTPQQVHDILTSSTLDTMAPGPDRDSGYGIVMANAAVQAALALR